MGLLDKDPAKAQQKQIEKEARRQAAEQEAQEKAARAEAERFTNSPQGRAREAREEGSTLFEISLPVASTQKARFGDFSQAWAPTATRTRNLEQMNVIEAIELEGWRLEHVGYVFQPTGTESRDKFLASGQIETVMGNIVGCYLFRLREEVAADTSGSQT